MEKKLKKKGGIRLSEINWVGILFVIGLFIYFIITDTESRSLEAQRNYLQYRCISHISCKKCCDELIRFDQIYGEELIKSHK